MIQTGPRSDVRDSLAARHLRTICGVCLAVTMMPGGLLALELKLPPQAVQTETTVDSPAPYGVATGPAILGKTVPMIQVTGPRQRTAWRLTGASETAAAVLNDLTAQIRAAGYEPLFTCETSACGGFDFRLSLPVLPMPSMFVDLGDFIYASAALPASDHSAPPVALVSVLISRSSTATFVQVSDLSGQQSAGIVPDLHTGTSPQAISPPPAEVGQSGIGTDLMAQGHIALDDVAFEAGSARLSDDASGAAQLQSLAAFLAADPVRRIALVGHSDWTGGLEANIALSRARAQSVAAALTAHFGVPARQISVEGIGFLAPRRANTSEDGLQANRRVEAVLLPDAP